MQLGLAAATGRADQVRTLAVATTRDKAHSTSRLV
jgi:hypothetical protein